MPSRLSCRQRGSIMIYALVVLTFAIIVGASFTRTSVFGKSTAASERQLSQAYYAAESGLTEVLKRPALYGVTDALFPDGAPPVTNYSSPEFTMPGQPDLKFSFTVELVRDDVYRIDSFGSTPYATAMASAEVTIQSVEAMLGGMAYHMGSLNATLNTSGVPGSGAGSPTPINHHFSGSDMAVYGSLYFEKSPEMHGQETYNIWGGKFHTWNWFIEPSRPDLGFPPHLVPKHADLDENASFPFDVADAVRDNVLDALPVADWTPPTIVGKTLQVGSGWAGGSPVPGRVEYDQPLGNIEIIEGLGFLRLNFVDNTYAVDIKELIPRGPLTIVTNATLRVGSIGTFTSKPGGPSTKYDTFDAGGHRLVIISEKSIFIGKSSNDYDPMPKTADERWNNCYFLGSDSVLWARHDLVIDGQIRAGRPSDYGNLDPNTMQIIEWNATTATIEPSPPTVGNLILVSRESRPDDTPSSLSFHTMDSGGMVYAGSKMKIYRLRMKGLAFFEDPYQVRPVQGGGKAVGLMECNLSADSSTILDGPFGDAAFMTLIRRLK